jgi:hypothetical protein
VQDNRVSRKGGISVLIIMEALWGNNLNFIKDVPIIYVNFIILVIIKKYRGITFVLSLVNTKCFLDVCELNETISGT